MAKYLYNGLELPELPEWDTTAYPYAYIYYVGETPAFCTLVLVPADAEIVFEEGTSAILFSTTHYRSYYARSVDEQWDDNGITETSDSIYLLKPWLDYPDNYTTLQWTNFNVYNKDNELMLPKSDPIPIEDPVPDQEKFDLKSWMTGFALGLAGKPLPFAPAQKEPVAYLYGPDKVRLPKLPVVEGYNHAYLCKIWTDSYKVAHLFLTAEHLGITADRGYITSANVRIDCKHFEFYLEAGTEWEDGSRTFFMYQQTYEPFWTNTDMEEYLHDSGELGVEDDTYTPTGEVGLYASNPIPVYE